MRRQRTDLFDDTVFHIPRNQFWPWRVGTQNFLAGDIVPPRAPLTVGIRGPGGIFHQAGNIHLACLEFPPDNAGIYIGAYDTDHIYPAAQGGGVAGGVAGGAGIITFLMDLEDGDGRFQTDFRHRPVHILVEVNIPYRHDPH
ncbi:MAG: hypothetical protein BWY09_02940 [Candidatus Hydrogenedentes bacterium ADurb.Bin179]|nr:MAG: hypothetical protein BWY09_02940 [Candidatus Hydrogenedentes bacterium ADurb.Bin179]